MSHPFLRKMRTGEGKGKSRRGKAGKKVLIWRSRKSW